MTTMIGRAEASVYTNNSQVTVYGDIPTPIDIPVSFYWDITGNREPESSNHFQATALVYNMHSSAYYGVESYIQGIRVTWNDGDPQQMITLTDADRTIFTSINADADPQFTINDVHVGFTLPANLSLAPAVPEPATWLLLMLGFAALFGTKRFIGARA